MEPDAPMEAAMSSPWTVTEANGLHTTANAISGATPRGSMKRADNVVIRAKDVIEPRRGQGLLGYEYGQPYSRMNEVFFLGGEPVSQWDTSRLVRDTGSALTEYTGSFAPPDAATLRMKAEEVDGQLLFTTTVGLKVLESISSTPRAAGIPRPFNVEVLSDVVDAGAAEFNWLDDNFAVSVRVLFGRRDDNEKLGIGPPSERAVIINDSGDSRAVDVVIGLPDGLTTEHFYRIYMTETVADTLDPGEEHWLVYETKLSAADLTAGMVTKRLTNIEAVLSDVALYTNPNSGSGPSAAKLAPPLAKDVCRWGGRLWGFNLIQKHQFTLTLLGLSDDGDSTGVDKSDESILTINGVTYVLGYAAMDPSEPANGEVFEGNVVVHCNGDAFDTAGVAKNLVEAINLNDEDIRAYYVAREDGWPGEILIEEAAIGGDGFSIFGDLDNYLAFYPQLPLTSGDALVSDNRAEPNGFTCSDINEPESWPLTNYSTAGNKGAGILRGCAVRDAIYALMSDGSIQAISGGAAPFRVDTLDSTAKLVGPDTACVLNNQVWCLTTQGVVTVSEAGVGIVGLPIEVDVRSLFGGALATTRLVSFGFGYETERSYCLWLPTRAGQASPDRGFIYNYATKAWTRWPIPRRCGRVNPVTDVLYMGHATDNTGWKERKRLTPDDLADDAWDIALTSFSRTSMVVDDTSGISEGDGITQGDLRSVVAEVIDATHLKLADSVEWDTPGSLTVSRAIECIVDWQPTPMGSPSLVKNVSDFVLHFLEASFVKAEAFLATDKSGTWARAREFARNGFGAGEWGEFAWGDEDGPTNARAGVPENKGDGGSYHPRFIIREAFASWKLGGYTLQHDVVSERTGK